MGEKGRPNHPQEIDSVLNETFLSNLQRAMLAVKCIILFSSIVEAQMSWVNLGEYLPCRATSDSFDSS